MHIETLIEMWELEERLRSEERAPTVEEAVEAARFLTLGQSAKERAENDARHALEMLRRAGVTVPEIYGYGYDYIEHVEAWVRATFGDGQE